jgi:LacI family transcriptional regulator
MDAVKEMNYIPNSIARKLQQKETKVIGVIIPDITETFFASVIKGIEEVLSEKGYSIFLCNTNENADKERKYVDLLYENRVDGIIVATVRNNIASDDILFNGNIPFIFIDNTPNEGNQFNSVTTDNFLAGKMAADYLISKGHTKIAAIMGKQDETTGRKRFEGFLKGLEENSISKDESLYKFCDFKEASGCRAMEELIEQKGLETLPVTDVLFVYDPKTEPDGYEMMKNLRAEGYRVEAYLPAEDGKTAGEYAREKGIKKMLILKEGLLEERD